MGQRARAHMKLRNRRKARFPLCLRRVARDGKHKPQNPQSQKTKTERREKRRRRHELYGALYLNARFALGFEDRAKSKAGALHKSETRDGVDWKSTVVPLICNCRAALPCSSNPLHNPCVSKSKRITPSGFTRRREISRFINSCNIASKANRFCRKNRHENEDFRLGYPPR